MCNSISHLSSVAAMFKIIKEDKDVKARTGVFATNHGALETPASTWQPVPQTSDCRCCPLCLQSTVQPLDSPSQIMTAG